MPYVAINVAEGLDSVDRRLVQMSDAFGRRRGSIVRHVLVPSRRPVRLRRRPAVVRARLEGRAAHRGLRGIVRRRVPDPAGIRGLLDPGDARVGAAVHHLHDPHRAVRARPVGAVPLPLAIGGRRVSGAVARRRRRRRSSPIRRFRPVRPVREAGELHVPAGASGSSWRSTRTASRVRRRCSAFLLDRGDRRASRRRGARSVPRALRGHAPPVRGWGSRSRWCSVWWSAS